MSGQAFALRRGHQPSATRCDSVSRHWTGQPAKFIGTPHTDAFGDFPQLGTSRRKETGQRPTVAEFRHSVLPALVAKTRPCEDRGHLRRDRRLSLAKGNRILRKAAKAQGEIRATNCGIDFNSPRSTRETFRLFLQLFGSFAALRLCVRSPAYPPSRIRPRPPQRSQPVPRADSQSNPSGCNHPRQESGRAEDRGHAVVPASDRHIDQLSARHGHTMSPAEGTNTSVRIHGSNGNIALRRVFKNRQSGLLSWRVPCG
jgi:hypothetical protein